MRYFLLTVLFLSFFNSKAQFTTPNTGQTYDLDDLVTASSGVITFDTGFYAFHNDVTISINDTFIIDSTTKILMAPGVLITSLGHLNLNPFKGQLFIDFLPLIAGQSYRGLRIENDDNSILRGVFFIEAGGIRILNANLKIESCVFINFDQSHSTGVINLFESSPDISNCRFQGNDGPVFNSGANVFSAPKIRDCYLEFNNNANTNAPQINLGPSGPGDTIIIKGNTIRGNRNNTMVGGISTSNLLGTAGQNVVIDSNLIFDNRYGITCTGSNINATITRNTILDNNSQNSPNLGGSGINFNGGNTNIAFVGNNDISGNLWGITIQGNAQPNIGDTTMLNTGYNCFSNNENQGTIYALYNNTPNSIKAQLNDWDDSNPENVIVHNVDISNLGLVDFSLEQTGLENIDISVEYIIINDTIYFSNQTFGNVVGMEWLLPPNELYYQLNPIHLVQPFGTLNPYTADIRLRGDCSSKDSIVIIDLSCGFSVNYPPINLSIDTMNSNIEYSENISTDSASATLNYFWDFGDGSFTTDSTGIHNYDSSGNYLLTLKVSNQCGDTLTFSDSVFVPSIIALKGEINSAIQIYPNPFSDKIHLKGHKSERFEILNIHGQCQFSGTMKSAKDEINLSQLESGVYFLRVFSANNLESTLKLIKM